MKLFTLILTLCILVPGRLSEAHLDSFAQFGFAWPKEFVKWNNEWTTQGQRDFANTVYQIGVEYGDKGHTAVGIAWMERSLGATASNKGKSPGYCGLTEIALEDLEHGPEVFDSLKVGTLSLEREIFLALDYFSLCEKRLRNNGLSRKEAWYFAYPKYSTGSKWKRFGLRAQVFNQRVRFLVNDVFPIEKEFHVKLMKGDSNETTVHTIRIFHNNRHTHYSFGARVTMDNRISFMGNILGFNHGRFTISVRIAEN